MCEANLMPTTQTGERRLFHAPEPARKSGAKSRALGNHAKRFHRSTTRVSEIPTAAAAERRERREALKAVQAEVTTIRRSRWCGRIPGRTPAGRNAVQIAQNDEAAYYRGLARCGSAWACPTCAAKIRYERGLEIQRGIEAHQANGGAVLLGTYTAPHYRGETLDELWTANAKAYSATRRGRRAKDRNAELALVASIRAFDLTHGQANGWHHHIHALFFVRGDVTEAEIAALEVAELAEWNHQLAKQGRPPASEAHGVKIQKVRDGAMVGAYMAKPDQMGMELTRTDLKEGGDGNRTPFQILEDYARTGNPADLALWHEYEKASKHKSLAHWNRGAKERFGITETTDDEIVEKEEGGETVHTFTPEEWSAVLWTAGAKARCLRIVEQHGVEALRRYLDEIVQRQRTLDERAYE